MKQTVSRMERVYVTVNSDFDSTGFLHPRAVKWSDGRVFQIEKVKDYRPAGSHQDSLTCDRYTVVINGEIKYLFFERTSKYQKSSIGRWYVECPLKA